MNDASYSNKLRNLCSDYYNQKITKAEYRNQRKILLDKIDEEYNGRQTATSDNESKGTDQSIFMKTIAFFKNKDIDQ